MRRSYPKLSIYSEESGELGGSSELKLVLDPIDGTVIWSTGFADYYSIAAAFLRSGVLTSSVIFFPALGSLYVAERGRGAWRKDGSEWKRLKVSNEDNFQHSIVAVDHGKEKRQVAPPIMHRLLDPKTGVTCVPQFLCSSYTLVKLSEGAIHGYVSPSAPCEDALPGLLMAIEAGATVGTFAGRGEWSQVERSVVVGCTEAIYENIQSRIKG
jgi:myo-inositol-1(or 4)-monophosphatase